jgi:hypothetical protein
LAHWCAAIAMRNLREGCPWARWDIPPPEETPIRAGGRAYDSLKHTGLLLKSPLQLANMSLGDHKRGMDIIAAAAAGNTAIETIRNAGALKRNLDRWRNGKLDITHPQNRASHKNAPDGWLHLNGTHENAKGDFWLFTVDTKEDKYWVHTSIRLTTDNRWSERININSNPGPREVTIFAFRVSPVVNDLLRDTKDKQRALARWDPIAIRSFPTGDMRAIDSVILTVL